MWQPTIRHPRHRADRARLGRVNLIVIQRADRARLGRVNLIVIQRADRARLARVNLIVIQRADRARLGRVNLIVIQRADRARWGRVNLIAESRFGAREVRGSTSFYVQRGSRTSPQAPPSSVGRGSISVIPISARLNTTFDGVWCCPEPVVHSIDRCYPLTPVAKMAWEWAFRGLSPKSWAMALATASMISSAGALARSLIS